MSEAAQWSGFVNSDDLATAERRYRLSGAEELGFTRSEFGEMLEGVICRAHPNGCSEKERQRFLAGLRLDELVLAQACARGFDQAWERFLVLYREKLCAAAIAVSHDESVAHELVDSLYADLYRSKLKSYMGRGSLEGWLKTVLAQAYVTRYRSQRRLVPFDDEIEAESQSRDLVFVSDQGKVTEATDAVLGALSEDERFLLAAYHLDGRTLAEIGRMMGLHESTIARRLEKVTSALRGRIIKKLCEGAMSKRAAQEMLDLDVRDLQVDVRGLLAGRKA